MNTSMKEVREFAQSKLFRKMLCGLGVLVGVLTLFQAGVFVGYRKAAFSYRWGESYSRTFGDSERRFGGMPMRGELSEAHGVTGKILKVELPIIIVEGDDRVEKIVAITEDTVVRRFRDTITPTDLAVGDYIVAIGSPNTSSQIEARLIRIMPTPPQAIGTSTPNTTPAL